MGAVGAHFAAECACEAIHGVTDVTHLLARSQTFNVAAVPHHPAPKGQQHQKNPCVHQQVPIIFSVHLQWCEDSRKQHHHTHQVKNDSECQSHSAVCQTSVVMVCGHPDCSRLVNRKQPIGLIVKPILSIHRTVKMTIKYNRFAQ